MRISPIALAALLAQLPLGAEAAGITYDCDTAADHYSELDLPAGPAPFAVTGNVQLRAMAQVKVYVPLARIQVSAATSPGAAPSTYAGFTLTAVPGRAVKSEEPAVQMLSYTVNGKEDETIPFSILAKPGSVQPFKLVFDGSSVTVTLGAETKSLPLATDQPVVRLICSTGEFLFTDLAVTPGR